MSTLSPEFETARMERAGLRAEHAAALDLIEERVSRAGRDRDRAIPAKVPNVAAAPGDELPQD